MKRIVTINDVDLTVYFSTTDFRAATFSQPADGGEIEIEAIYLEGNEISELLADAITEQIVDKLRQEAAEMQREAEEGEAERRADEARDMRLYREAA